MRTIKYAFIYHIDINDTNNANTIKGMERNQNQKISNSLTKNSRNFIGL